MTGGDSVNPNYTYSKNSFNKSVQMKDQDGNPVERLKGPSKLSKIKGKLGIGIGKKEED